MTPTAVKKKSFWTLAKKWSAASGITIVAAVGFVAWAGKFTEQKITRPYICGLIDSVVFVKKDALHKPLEDRLENLENDTKVIRFIVEAGTDPAVIQAAVAKANDSTFRVR